MKNKIPIFYEIFYVRVMRIVIKYLQYYYATLGIVYTNLRDFHVKVDNYIAKPKPNNH